MYIIKIFRTIFPIFVAMFITTFRPLYAPNFFWWLECRTYPFISLKMVAEDIKFIRLRNSCTDVLKDT